VQNILTHEILPIVIGFILCIQMALHLINTRLEEHNRNPADFIWLKEKSAWEKPVIPLMAKKEILSLYQIFCPKNGKILIAYDQEKPVAGIFLLFSGKVAYYWLAAASNLGKKLFAPNLLVYEALLASKKVGCGTFDFEGIYDERFPIKSWLGFTKFKEGFGGREVIYPPSLIKTRFSCLFPGFTQKLKITKITHSPRRG